MQTFNIILAFAVIAGMIAVLLWLKKHKADKMYCVALGAFGLYMLGHLYITLLSRSPNDEVLHPLATLRMYQIIRDCIAGSKGEGLDASNAKVIEEGLLNILLFIPMGCLLPVLLPKARLWKILVLALAVSFATECLQRIFLLGWFDVDDMIYNTLGALLGYLLCAWLFPAQIHGCKEADI